MTQGFLTAFRLAFENTVPLVKVTPTTAWHPGASSNVIGMPSPGTADFSWAAESSPLPPSAPPTAIVQQGPGQPPMLRVESMALGQDGVVPEGLRGTLRVRSAGAAAAASLAYGSASASVSAVGVGRSLASPVEPLDLFGIDGSEGIPEHFKSQLGLARRRAGSSTWEDYNAAIQELGMEGMSPVAHISTGEDNGKFWLYARSGESIRGAYPCVAIFSRTSCPLTCPIGLSLSSFGLVVGLIFGGK